MSATLLVACITLSVFVVILVALALTRNSSEPDAITQNVVRQGLTGPVPLPARARLAAPNRQGEAAAGEKST